jgi:hypothetical protein
MSVQKQRGPGLVFGLVLFMFSASAGNAADWLLVGEHYHTNTDVAFSQDPRNHPPRDSYSTDGIRMLLERGAKGGLAAMIVTEHNSVATCFDSLFEDKTYKVTLICGEEWTTHKSLHLGLLNPPVSAATESYFPTDPEKVRDPLEVESEARGMIRDLHQSAAKRGQDSLVVVNHPGFKMYQASDSLGADAAEALVPDYEDAPKSRLWWLKRLATGQRMIALGGSDYHACTGWDCIKRGDVFRGLFNEPVNLVYADSAAPQDVMSALARGRVVALSSLKHKDVRIEIFAAAGNHEYGMGETVPGLKSGDTLSFRARIQNAEGLYAVVYGIGTQKPYRVVRQHELDSNDFKAVFETTRASSRDALHIELFEPVDWNGHDDGLPVAISNPIYF